MIAETPRRKRAQPEQDERTDAVRHQVFPARDAEIGGNRAHRRRKDKEKHVIERVGNIQQQRG